MEKDRLTKPFRGPIPHNLDICYPFRHFNCIIATSSCESRSGPSPAARQPGLVQDSSMYTPAL
eukprot:8416005-Prorocentrum_lima.AAC.1